MTDRELVRALLTENLPRVLTAATTVQTVKGTGAADFADTVFRVNVLRLKIRLENLAWSLGRALEAPEPLHVNALEDAPPQTLEEALEEVSRTTGIEAPPVPRGARRLVKLAEILEAGSRPTKHLLDKAGQ